MSNPSVMVNAPLVLGACSTLDEVTVVNTCDQSVTIDVIAVGHCRRRLW